MESLEKHLLIASPYMLDPNFQRTVVLMVQHSDEGAFGLVINRPTDKLLKDLWREINNSPCDSDEPVHLGGPVPGPIMAIHTDPTLGEKEIIPGLYFCLKTRLSTNWCASKNTSTRYLWAIPDGDQDSLSGN